MPGPHRRARFEVEQVVGELEAEADQAAAADDDLDADDDAIDDEADDDEAEPDDDIDGMGDDAIG